MQKADHRTQSYEAWQHVAAGWEKRDAELWRATEPVSRDLVARLDPKSGDTVLELAAGVGQTGLLAAEAVGPNGRVISTDFAPAMVEAARRLSERVGARNIEHRVMDAEQIDLPDASVDGVLCRWGYMLVTDPARAFAETRRVLSAEGRLAFAVWATPDANPWATVFGRVLAASGALPPPEPNAPGMFSMASGDRIEELVRGAGFETVDITDVPVAFTYESFDQYWTVTLELGGGLAKALAALDETEQQEIRAAIEDNAGPYRTDGGYELPGLSRSVLARQRPRT